MPRPQGPASASCSRLSPEISASVALSRATFRLLERVLGWRATAPVGVLITPSSILTVPAVRSRSFHRTAQASPLRIPVAATSRISTATRTSAVRAASRSARTSAGSGDRRGLGLSAGPHEGSSVSTTGFGRVLPLHFRASRHDRLRGGGPAGRSCTRRHPPSGHGSSARRRRGRAWRSAAFRWSRARCAARRLRIHGRCWD